MHVNEAVGQKWEGGVKGIIHTKIGDGPRTLGEDDALLDASGLPKKLA